MAFPAAGSGTRVRAIARLALGLAVAATPVPAAELATPRVLDKLPHDTSSFTQGFLYHDGSFYESTGRYGQSALRRNDPATGASLLRIDLDPDEFGEGLARVGDELIQLTWRENVAHRYRLDNFWRLEDHAYTGEGWGLCHDGERLVMTNGTSNLYFRDPETFQLLGSVQVTLDSIPISWLNELECVGRLVYANVWQSSFLLRIDPDTGVALTRIDAPDLLTPQEASQADVLNGIAFHPATSRFYLTGKLWPWVFEVDFDFNPYGGCEAMGELGPVSDLLLSKDGPEGVAFTWEPDPQATEYHVNSVSAVNDLPEPGLHRPDRNGGAGESRCEAQAPATACTDAFAQSDPRPLLFFRVYSACGPGGIDEGPR